MARICMVVNEYYPKDFRVRREAEALTSGGHAVQVIALRKPEESWRERVGGVDVVRAPLRRHRGSALPVYLVEYAIFFTFAFWMLAYLHLRRRFDIVHVHSPPDFLVFAALIPRWFGARVILDIHDRVPELYAERFSRRPGIIRALVSIEGASSRFADRVITVTQRYAERLIRPGVPPEKIEIILNSADERLFPQPTRPIERDAAELKSRDIRLFHHGTLMKRYGVDVLVEAVYRVLSIYPRVRLDVLGDGDLMPSLKKLVRERGIEQHVLLHGYMRLDEMAKWIEQADLCIVPNRRSAFTDGILPTKLLEYVAMGRPVVVTRTDVVGDYFREESLCYVPSDDPEALAQAISSFIEDPKPFWNRAQTALIDYEPLRWQGQAERLNKLVRDLVGVERSQSQKVQELTGRAPRS